MTDQPALFAPIEELPVAELPPPNPPPQNQHSFIFTGLPGAPGWERSFDRSSKGVLLTTPVNIMLIMRNAFSGCWRYNTMSETIEWARGGGHWVPLDDSCLANIQAIISQQYGLTIPLKNIVVALKGLQEQCPHHPIKDYMANLTWDGVPRLSRVLQDALGAETDNALYQTYLRKFFISATARAMKPGCKVDTVLVLYGRQGARKSAFFQALTPNPDLFCDTKMDVANKDAYLALGYTWIWEWSEVDQITSTRSAPAIKSFLTSPIDKYRPPYAATTVSVPRTCIFVGTTNEERFLSDPTGNRRFWVVPVGPKVIDTAWVVTHRDQLWAEAKAAYIAGETWWLDDDQSAAQEQETRENHTTEDSWEETIASFVSGSGNRTWSQFQWTDMTQLPSRFETATVNNLAAPRPLTVDLIYALALEMPIKDRTTPNGHRIGRIMRRLGWVTERRRVGGIRLSVWTPGPTADPLPVVTSAPALTRNVFDESSFDILCAGPTHVF